MPRENVLHAAFNRGIVSRLALARTDIKRVAMSAEIQTNWMPRVLGSMMLRPGMGHIDSTKNDAVARHLPFVFALDDTAILEFTDQALRVRVDEEIISRAAVTTAIVDGTFDGTDAIANVTVAGAPTEAVTAAGFSPSGTLFATGQVNSPFVKLWSVSGTTFTALSNPASLPTGQVNSLAFSPNGQFLALGLNVSPYIEVYTISGTTFTKLPAFTALAGAAGFPTAVSFSDDGQYMAVAHATTPFCTVYSISGTTFTKLTGGNTSQFCNSADLPAGTGMGTSFRAGSTHLAVAHTTTPFVSIYTVGAVFAKLGNPANLPAGNATACAFNATVGNGNIDLLAVSHASSPFVTLYGITDSGATYTKKTNTGTLPDGNANGVAFSPNGLRLGVVHATTQFLSLYHVDPEQTSYLVKETDPGTIPAGQAFSLAFSSLNALLAVGTATSTFFNMYQLRPWIDYDQSGTTSQYFGGILGTRLLLAGSLFNEARRTQGFYVPVASRSIEHALTISIASGPVTLRVGSTYRGEELIGETTLTTGEHSLAFTPTAAFVYIQFSAIRQYNAGISTCTIAGSGEMSLTSPYELADLPMIRIAQSADVVYVACDGEPQYKVERRGETSWSLVKYQPEDGPFRTVNTSQITITPSALTGQITLAASRPFFREGHVGGLIKLTSVGQQTDDDFTGANQFSASNIRVTGVGTARTITIVRAGTWSATVTLQRSLTEPGSWTDVATFISNGTASYTDGLDNQIVFYRIGIKTGGYTSGTAEINMDYAAGGLDGIARISLLTTSQSVFADVLSPLGSVTATENWAEGEWSDYRGFPSAVTLFEGRLNWAGKDRVWGSVVDAFESFDPEVEGDSGPFARSIGEGPVDSFSWLLGLQRLILGGQMAEFSAKSSNFDEPLTPSNFNLKASSTQGSAPIDAVRIDNTGIFADRSGTKVFQLSYNVDTYDYNASDLTLLCPELAEAGVVRLAVQRRPDTRVHAILGDGTAIVMILEPGEEVTCWIPVETDGDIEDVVILPDTPEDAVYYTVKRTINSVTKRYLELWALESECRGATLNRQADSFVTFTNGPASATVTGLDHLEGKDVVVWADGKCMKDADGETETFTVTAGSITLTNGGAPYLATTGIVGLSYEARFKSTKLAYAAGGGTAINRRKRLIGLGLVLADTHAQGLEIGDDFTNMVGLPSTEAGATVDPDSIWDEYDYEVFSLNSAWKSDARLCLKATAPRPCTILAATLSVETSG